MARFNGEHGITTFNRYELSVDDEFMEVGHNSHSSGTVTSYKVINTKNQ